MKNSLLEKVVQRLVLQGRLPPDKAEHALRASHRPTGSERIGYLLCRLGLATESDVLEALAGLFGLATMSKADLPPKSAAWALVPEKFARALDVIPLFASDEELTVGICDPLRIPSLDGMARAAGRRILPILMTPSDVKKQMLVVYNAMRLEGRADIGSATSTDRDKDADDDARAIGNLANELLKDAIEAQASDIHVEPGGTMTAVRFRIDGILQEIRSIPVATALALISRLKVLGELDISERSIPQDGRFRVPDPSRGINISSVDRAVDIRVSTLPVMHGEKMVMRLLDPSESIVSLDALGLDPDIVRQVREVSDLPDGLILVVGPTGSGKTSSLYAAIRHIADPSVNIVSVENPVEFEVAGINQVNVNTKKGLTFATALRSILRQDPDVIIIGEIRDRETAAIAADAAITGHQVFATLHAPDVLITPIRMAELGLPSHALAPALTGIWAQRLPRRVCRECSFPVDAMPADLALLGLPEGLPALKLMESKGCAACIGTGFKGRFAVAEFLTVTPPIRAAIACGADAATVARLGEASGYRPMWYYAVKAVLDGQTTVAEAMRVFAA